MGKMKNRLKKWLQELLIEAWESYETEFRVEVYCKRDPNKVDINY